MKRRTTAKAPELGLPSRRPYMDVVEEMSERPVVEAGRWRARRRARNEVIEAGVKKLDRA
jgi:hypothetical protein